MPGTWANCRGCNRRYDDLDPKTRMCAPCHNAAIDARAAATGRSVPRPAWCGKCDERTRHVDVCDESRIANGYDPWVAARCPRCHPLAANRLRSVA